MDKIRALRYFLKVADTSSFSQAGRFFEVPASSISRRIKDLEQDLQVDLFHRSTRVVRLTDLGQLYYDQVKEALNALDYADELVSQKSQVPSGRLKISAMPGYGRIKLLPVIEKFRQAYPDITLDVELTDHLVDITKNEVDIAIRASANLPDRVIARKISDHRFLLLASPEYLNTHGTPKNVADLSNHKTLLYRGPNGVLNWQAQVGDNWQDIQTQPTYISNDGNALIEAALRGEGLTLLPQWGVEAELASGSLIEIPIKDGPVTVARTIDSSIYLLYLKPRYNILKIKVAVDFLVNELSK